MTLLNGKPIKGSGIESSTAVSGPTVSATPTPTPPLASAESRSVGSIAGVIAIVLGFVLPIGGIIVGGIALREAKLGGYRNPLAKAGFVLGIVLTAVTIVAIAVGVWLGWTAFSELFRICSELGNGVHVRDGVSYSCNG